MAMTWPARTGRSADPRMTDRPTTVGDMTRSTRRRVTGGAATIVLLSLVAIVFTEAVLTHGVLAGLDGTWRDWVLAHRNGALTEVMVNASRFGSTPALVVYALVAAVWLLRRERRRDSLLVVAVSAGGLALGPVLKVVVARPRPALHEHVVFVDSWSYPSGHSLNTMVVLGLLTVLAMRERPGWLWRTPLAVLGAFLVFTVGFSRVYLGVHWPSDVLAGWLIGVFWLAVCLTLAHGNSPPSGTVPRGS
jgi:undecaprenyl-diphosphatase